MDDFDVRDVTGFDSLAETVGVPTGQPANWAGEWFEALQRMELDVTSAESLLQSLHDQVDEPPKDLPVLGGEWSRPALVGPVPAEFADRARSLLARQSRVAEDLARAMIESRQQLKGLKKFDRPEAHARFIDTAM